MSSWSTDYDLERRACEELLRERLSDRIDGLLLLEAGFDPGFIFRLQNVFNSPHTRTLVVLQKKPDEVLSLLMSQERQRIEQRVAELREKRDEQKKTYLEKLEEERQQRAKERRREQQRAVERKRAYQEAIDVKKAKADPTQGALPIMPTPEEPEPLDLTPMERAVYGLW